MHPLQNLIVLEKISEFFPKSTELSEEEHKKLVAEKKIEWCRHFNETGFSKLSKVLEHSKGKYCFGDEVTLADCFLLPQFRGAVARFKIDPTKYPLLKQICDNLLELEAFTKALPENQPDFVA